MVRVNKLLLINPWQTYEKKLESEFQSYIPYGLACIASIGIKMGYETKIVDCLEDEQSKVFHNSVRFGKSEEEVKKAIIEFNPDIVGISSSFSMFESDATGIAQIVKALNKNIIVILGGVTATIREIYEPLLRKMDVYDIMCIGEGEETFAELLDNFDYRKKKINNLSSIKGIAYKKNNVIISTGFRPYITNLDSLPFPALDLLNIDKILKNKFFSRWRNNPINKRAIPIFTSRGCPYHCCFCSVHSQVGYNYRVYSNEYVIGLMKECINKYGINHFHFEDDNLTLNIVRAKALFREIEKLKITWDTPNGIRADRVDEEMIDLMIKSGAVSLSIAAESGNEYVREKIIHKSLKTESIVQAARLCDKYNLPCIVFFVLGFPGETMENIRQTITFAKKLSESFGTINMIYIANPLPGTELSRISREKGYIKREMSNSDYFTAIRVNQSPIIQTENFNKQKIFSLLQEELDSSQFVVHNISLPMFWVNNEVANKRAKRVFPKMSNHKVVWKWENE